MKSLALIPQDPILWKDRIFNQDYKPYCFWQEQLKKLDIDLHTIDYFNNLDKCDALIIFDIITLDKKEVKSQYIPDINKFIGKKILVTFEAPIILPENWDLEKHKLFNFVFTWNDDIIDNKKYFKYYWEQHRIKSIKWKSFEHKNFLTLINSNRTSFHKDELYTQRREIIDFLGNQIPNDFDLYGRGWGKTININKNKLIQSFKSYNLIKYLNNYFTSRKTPICYRGEIENKHTILSHYKFAICYENMTNINGYITEKIWDCLKVGVVPIYWGANNICDFIPKECFIDRRKFKNNQELLNFLQRIDKETYSQYQKSIKKFLETPEAKIWFDETWAKNNALLIKQLLK